MNGCLVPNKQGFWLKLKDIVDESVTLGMDKGPVFIKNKVFDLIEEARTSPQPESQLALLKTSKIGRAHV